MNKELTPLEAFNDLMAVYYEDNVIREKCGITEKTFNEKRKIIETALKDYEKKTKLAKEYADVNNVAKRLKALEIITKTFDFDIELGSLSNGTPTYKLNVWCKGSPIVVKPISKEEFDLLKEVLK